jgi:nucleoside-diphosphate-sugar epimerase
MKIFVTGGTGMTGSYLLYHLIKKNYTVFASLRKSSNLEHVKKIFKALDNNNLETYNKINWIEVELSDYLLVSEATIGIDYVYHVAAMVSFKPSERNLMIYNNVQSTANIVNACIENGIKKLCHVSSVAALGDANNGESLTEETEKTNFKTISGYALSKYQSEKEVWRGAEEGLNMVIVNPSIILGAGNWLHGSPRMFKTVWDGLKYYTKGENGFVDVNDLVNVMILLTESNISNERYIVNGENLSFRDVFNYIADNFNKKRANIYAADYMLHTLKTWDNIRFYFTGKEPRLTKHTIHSAQIKHTCSNEKITKTLNYNFKPIKQSVKEISNIFLTEFQSFKT